MSLPRIPLFAVACSLAAGAIILGGPSLADLLAAALPTATPVDSRVILLFAPMCLLMLGLLAETTRHALSGTLTARPIPARSGRPYLVDRS